MQLPVQYGLIYDFRNPQLWERPWQELYDGLLAQIETAEQLGFDTVWLTEHHFAEDGYLPSLFPVAAAIAMRTTRMRIGLNALVAALHHPVRVAEDAAIVDILSGGRLDIGLTMGFREVEYRQFGLPFDFRRRVERLKDVALALQQAYSGQGMEKPVRPPPIQQPHPPIYVGANATSALAALAPLGLPLLLIGGREKLHFYRQTQVASGLDPSAIAAPVQSLGMFLYVAENSHTAWETIRPHARYVVEQDRLWAGKDSQVADAELTRFGVVGSPEEVAELIVRRVGNVQPSQVCFFANPPGMDPKMATESLRLFATRVRPLVDARLRKSA